MKNIPKNIPMILLLITPYIIMVSGSRIAAIPYMCGFIPFAIILLMNMVYAFFLPRLGFEGIELLFWDLLLKLCNIPAFAGLLLINMVMVMFRVEGGSLVTMLLAYVLLLSSTMFGVSGLIRCYKNGLISRKSFVIHLILHFIFVADVVSAVWCFSKMIKKEKEPAEQWEGQPEEEPAEQWEEQPEEEPAEQREEQTEEDSEELWDEKTGTETEQ